MLRMLLAALTAVLILPATADAAFPGANGRIAFNWTFGCNGSAIATMQPDGSDVRLLTADPCAVAKARSAYPDYTADGSQIVFLREPDLFRMTADGSRQTALGVTNLHRPFPSRPSVSPNGKRVAYLREPHGRFSSVYTSKLDGTGEKHLRSGFSPRYSPDGRFIAYSSRTYGRITILRAATGEIVRRLPTHKLPPRGEFGGGAGDIDWSPDGRRIVYVRGATRDLWIIRADGSGKPRRILTTRRRMEESPVWSPDGERIAFVRELPRGGRQGVRYGIYTMPVSGGHSTRIFDTGLVSFDAFEFEPITLSWQPVVGLRRRAARAAGG